MTALEEKIYDVVIIGSGPGGMTAALYTSRANLSTLVIERGAPGGEMLNTADIENYPGFKSISGPDLAAEMYAGAMQFGAEYAYGLVDGIVLDGPYRVVKAGQKQYRAKAVIIATGAQHRQLGVSGEESLAGAGVSYCAVCDGAFFKGKSLYVIGGGDSAVEEGTYLTQFADKVTIVHRRDSLRAQPLLQERAKANPKVSFLYNRVCQEILGEGRVEGLRLQHVQTGEEEVVPADGVFIYIGLDPMSEPFVDLGITDEAGWIVTDARMQTKLAGIYAIGDVRAGSLRQITNAVGDGSTAGQAVYHYVEDFKA